MLDIGCSVLDFVKGYNWELARGLKVKKEGQSVKCRHLDRFRLEFGLTCGSV